MEYVDPPVCDARWRSEGFMAGMFSGRPGCVRQMRVKYTRTTWGQDKYTKIFNEPDELFELCDRLKRRKAGGVLVILEYQWRLVRKITLLNLEEILRGNPGENGGKRGRPSNESLRLLALD